MAVIDDEYKSSTIIGRLDYHDDGNHIKRINSSLFLNANHEDHYMNNDCTESWHHHQHYH